MDTIAAAITPLIAAPVITVRISGDEALKVFGLMRDSKNNPVDTFSLKPNFIHRYKFLTSNGMTDDVMAVYFKAPRSFTGEDVVEISFHGNPILLRSVFSSMFTIGFRNAMPGEFSKRAFLNGKMDLTQAEAVQDLIAAKSEKGIHYAYEQLAGSVRGQLDKMKSSLLELKAAVEAKIDFPDEDTVDDLLPLMKLSIADILKQVNQLTDAYSSLRFSQSKCSVVLAGKPNAGKSSLLNALLNEDRAIVSEVPGTTRDFIKEELYLGGLPLEIVDTAGVRKSSDEIEVAGISKTFDKILSADLVLIVLDLETGITTEDEYILLKTKNVKRLVVANKSDMQNNSSGDWDIDVSAKTGYNIDALKLLVKERIAAFDRTDDAVNVAPVTERHYFLLSEAQVVLASLAQDIDSKALDMIAFDIEFCLNKFMEITGERYSEQVLDIIFSKFCIGK